MNVQKNFLINFRRRLSGSVSIDVTLSKSIFLRRYDRYSIIAHTDSERMTPRTISAIIIQIIGSNESTSVKHFGRRGLIESEDLH